jgi:hypothetical protein
MKNFHSLTRMACLFFTALLVSSLSIKSFAQKDSLNNKYKNNYRYAVQLEISKYAGIKLERVWGKLQKPRFGVSAGIGYSQNPDLFSSRFDFSRGVKRTHFISNIHLLLPVSGNSDIEAGLAGNYNLLALKGQGRLTNEMVLMLKGGYRWHTANRKWSFHIGGLLTIADNLDNAYVGSSNQKFRFNLGNAAPSIAVGRTF